jgi:hypothetical protein
MKFISILVIAICVTASLAVSEERQLARCMTKAKNAAAQRRCISSKQEGKMHVVKGAAHKHTAHKALAKRVAKRVAKKAVQKAAKKVVKLQAKRAVSKAAKKATKRAARKAIKRAAKKAVKTAAKKAVKSQAKKQVKKAAKKETKKAVKKAAKKVVKKAAKKVVKKHHPKAVHAIQTGAAKTVKEHVKKIEDRIAQHNKNAHKTLKAKKVGKKATLKAKKVGKTHVPHHAIKTGAKHSVQHMIKHWNTKLAKNSEAKTHLKAEHSVAKKAATKKVSSKLDGLKNGLKKAAETAKSFFADIKEKANKAGQAAIKTTMKVAKKLTTQAKKNGRKLSKVTKSQDEQTNLQCAAHSWMAKIATYTQKVAGIASDNAQKAVKDMKKSAADLKKTLDAKFTKNTKPAIENAISKAKKAESKLGASLGSLSVDGMIDSIQKSVEKLLDNATKQVSSCGKDLQDKVSGLEKQFKTVVASFRAHESTAFDKMRTLYTNAKSVSQKIKEQLTRIKQQVQDRLDIEKTKMQTIATHAVEGFKGVAKDLQARLKTTTEEFYQVVDAFKADATAYTNEKGANAMKAYRKYQEALNDCIRNRKYQLSEKKEKLKGEALKRWNALVARADELNKKLQAKKDIAVEDWEKLVKSIENATKSD